MASAVPEGQDGGSKGVRGLSFKLRKEDSKRNAACARSLQPTVHELPNDARPRKTVVSSRFCVLGLGLDATTTQLIELTLTNVLGCRNGV